MRNKIKWHVKKNEWDELEDERNCENGARTHQSSNIYLPKNSPNNDFRQFRSSKSDSKSFVSVYFYILLRVRVRVQFCLIEIVMFTFSSCEILFCTWVIGASKSDDLLCVAFQDGQRQVISTSIVTNIKSVQIFKSKFVSAKPWIDQQFTHTLISRIMTTSCQCLQT